MDNIQKDALIALIAVGTIVSVYVIHTITSESTRVEAEQQAELNMCSDWSDNTENARAELNGREDSLGGTLDLDGSIASFRNHFNLEVDRFNAECAA